jgi:conjugal transfer pilus assembly protein TraF
MQKAIITTLLMMTFFTAAYSQSFYDDRDRGWYAYEKTSEPIEDETAELSKFLPEKPVIPWELLDVMAPAEFSKLLEQTKDYTLSFRTLENYEQYALMRNIAVKRAEEFASLSTFWAQLNPEATGESTYPVNTYGNQLWKAEKSENIAASLIQERSNFGLIYFYSETCPYCQKQAPVIRYFADAYGWTVESVDAVKSDVAAARFGITNVPSIVLVERKTGVWLLISGGIIDLKELEGRTYKSIRYLRGEINETNYDYSVYPVVGSTSAGKLAVGNGR